MNGLGVSGINVGDQHFRPDENFYSYSSYSNDGTIPLNLESLPLFLDNDQKPTVKEGFTKYQSEMELVLNESRNAVKASFAQLV